jgi:hypothetical protein
MKKANIRRYTEHLDYDADIDLELLNTRIRIFGEEYEETGIAYYEGSVGRFISERLPADFLVNLIAELKYKDIVAYKLSGGENYIQKIK